MSLLVDARKKSQQASGHATSPDELRLEDHSYVAGEPSDVADHTRSVENAARSAGQNLFNAKSPSSPAGRTMPNRNLLFALGGTILLLAIGGGYLWYLDSASDTALLRPMTAPPAPPAQPIVQAQPCRHRRTCAAKRTGAGDRRARCCKGNPALRQTCPERSRKAQGERSRRDAAGAQPQPGTPERYARIC